MTCPGSRVESVVASGAHTAGCRHCSGAGQWPGGLGAGASGLVATAALGGGERCGARNLAASRTSVPAGVCILTGKTRQSTWQFE